ncbi:hypothetical protein [[Mycoplasma] testudinis]|uniref:hypothetical protein n=1 Tax=[Mycoplasma] testudinis TaxID=33924 RepID=UPI00047FA8D3|nr:hypothetical protein [[Mycoplasma] testudinis]
MNNHQAIYNQAIGSTIFTSTVTPGDIAIYFFICLLVVILIGVILWTKVIRKAGFSYLSSNYILRYKRHKTLISLTKKGILKRYYINCVIINGPYSLGVFKSIIIGNNYVYLIAKPLLKNIYDVKYVKNKYITILKKSEKEINPEIDLFLKGMIDLRQQYKIMNQIKVVVPYLNENMPSKTINGVNFIKEKNIENFITDNEKNIQEENTKITADFCKKLTKNIRFLKIHFFWVFKNKWVFNSNQDEAQNDLKSNDK